MYQTYAEKLIENFSRKWHKPHERYIRTLENNIKGDLGAKECDFQAGLIFFRISLMADFCEHSNEASK
jgi:hypothetical protein